MKRANTAASGCSLKTCTAARFVVVAAVAVVTLAMGDGQCHVRPSMEASAPNTQHHNIGTISLWCNILVVGGTKKLVRRFCRIRPSGSVLMSKCCAIQPASQAPVRLSCEHDPSEPRAAERPSFSMEQSAESVSMTSIVLSMKDLSYLIVRNAAIRYTIRRNSGRLCQKK